MIKKLAKYKGLRVKKNKLEVKKQEIEKALDYLKNSRAKLITVYRLAEKGDKLEIDFEVRHNKVKIENGESKNHPLILGQGYFLPGFEKELQGMETNQEKEFSLKAPNDWSDKKIAGKFLDFKVKINLIQKRELPKINDEFAKSLGNFKSLKELEKSVKHGIIQEKEAKEKQRIRTELIEKVSQDSKVEISEELIEQEIDKMENEFKLIYPNYQNFNVKLSDLKKSWKQEAEKRIKIALCIDEIAQRENININNIEVEEKINQDLKQYPNVEEVKKNIDLDRLREYTKNVLRNQKVFEFLEKEAKII